ncbi:MAG: amidohydrolase family protein [Deltaproteobacteria bacterium]|nr:amidohydrolase family protein [Deltaproteobacteria bacterium]
MPAPQTYQFKNLVQSDGSVLSPAFVTVQQGRFTRVASTAETTPITDYKNATALPGFTNAHCHLELTALGPLPEQRFVPWIIELVRQKHKLANNNMQAGIIKGCRELLRSGVVRVFDHISPETPATVFENLPLKVRGFVEILGSHKERSLKSWQQGKEFCASAPLPSHLTLHSGHTVHPDVKNAFIKEQNRLLSIHLAECESENELVQTQQGEFAEFILKTNPEITKAELSNGSSALQILWEQNAFSNSLIVHGNHLSDNDIKLIAKHKDLCVVHCPNSYAFFDHGGFDFERLQQEGIPVALGTDGLVSNTELNMLGEIQSFLKTHPKTDLATLMPMITLNAAKALGLADEGDVKESYKADLVLMHNTENLEPLQLLKQKNQVDQVMLNGQWVI